MKYIVTFANGEKGEVDEASRYWAMVAAVHKFQNGSPVKVEPIPEPKMVEVDK